MRLMECLNQSDMRQLVHIAKVHQLNVPTYSKNAILQELIARFYEPDYIYSRIKNVHAPLQTVIQELALSGRDRYTKEELMPVIRRILSGLQSTAANPDELILELTREGILFETGMPSHRTYVFPEDLWKKIHAITTREVRSSILQAVEEPEIIREDGEAIARDATVMLFFCAKTPLRLTIDGSIYKRQQMQIMQLFEIQEEVLPERTGWRFGFHPHYRDYPERFALIYDFWSSSGVFIEKEGSLFVEEGAGQAILMFSEQKRAELLLRYYLQEYRSAIPNLMAIVKKIGELTRNAWIYKSAISKEIFPWIDDYFYETKEQMLYSHILGMLIYLGVLKEGQNMHTEEEVYQLTTLGENWLDQHVFSSAEIKRTTSHNNELEKAVVTPDFEIIIPSFVESKFGMDLQKIAFKSKNGKMRTYRLTQYSIGKSLEFGWSYDQILAFLNHITQTEIPQNVTVTIADWCAAYDRVRLENWNVIVCKDEGTALEVLTTLAPLHLNLKLESPTVLIFENKDKDQVKEGLKKMGFYI